MKIMIDTKMIEKAGLTGAAVYGYFAQNQGGTVMELARLLGKGRNTIFHLMAELEMAGYLEIIRMNPDKTDHSWIVGAEVLK